jgi:hypothetical protein
MKTLTDKQMLTLAQNVRANDLLLAGRDASDAPEGAGGWRYLLADAMGVPREQVTHVTVPTSEVNRLREIDKASRKDASAKAKADAPAPAKPKRARKTPAKATQTVEIATPTSVEARVDAMEVMLARIAAHIGA